MGLLHFRWSCAVIRKRAQWSEHVHNARLISRAVADSVIDWISIGVVAHFADSRLERKCENGGSGEEGTKGGGELDERRGARGAPQSVYSETSAGGCYAPRRTRKMLVKRQWRVSLEFRVTLSLRPHMHLTARLAIPSSYHRLHCDYTCPPRHLNVAASNDSSRAKVVTSARSRQHGSIIQVNSAKAHRGLPLLVCRWVKSREFKCAARELWDRRLNHVPDDELHYAGRASGGCQIDSQDAVARAARLIFNRAGEGESGD